MAVNNPRRVLDISPPRSEEGLRYQPPFGGPRKPGIPLGWKLALGVLFLGFAGVFVLHFFFAEATVRIWPETRSVTIDETVSVRADEETVDPVAKIVPGRVEEETLGATRIYESTGAEVKAQQAEGTIRIFNEYSASPQPLVATTRFVSEDGKLFRMPERVVVPGWTKEGGDLVPGTVDIRVVAAEAGEDYNIGPSNFSLPGLAGSDSYTLIYAKSFEPMSGGSREETPVVTEEDLESARETLLAELAQEAARRMEARLPEGFVADPESFAVEVLSASSPIQAGSQLDEFNYTAEATMTGLAFRRGDLEELVREYLQTELRKNETMDAASVQTSFTSGTYDEEVQSLTLQLHGESLGYDTLDPNEIKARLGGKNGEEARAILETRPQISRIETSFWPFWVRTIPRDTERITLEILTRVDG